MGYTTNSRAMNHFSGKEENPLEDFQTYIVPEWIFQAVVKKGSIADLHDYSKLRQAVSVSDVAALEAVRLIVENDLADIAVWGTSSFTTNLCINIPADVIDNPKLTPQGVAEIMSTVVPISRDPKFIAETKNRLRTKAELFPDSRGNSALECRGTPVVDVAVSPEELPYRVVLHNRTLYIRVKEGFLSHLEGRKERLVFLSHVLKSAYSVAPLTQVNNTCWYSAYLKTLAAPQ